MLHEIDDYRIMAECGQAFEGLMPKVIDKLGGIGGNGKQVSVFAQGVGASPIETVDVDAIANEDEGEDEDEPSPEPGPGPSPGPEPVEEPATWYLVKDQESWTEAYNAGPLAKYYELNPAEDRWNEEAGRAANFNDRVYVTTDGEKLQAEWYDENVQILKQVEGTGEYYFTQINPELNTEITLYNNADLQTEVKKVTLESYSYPGCEPDYRAMQKEVLPWAVVDVPEGMEGSVKMVHAGSEFVIEDTFNNGYSITNLHLAFNDIPSGEGSSVTKEDVTITLVH